MTGEGASVGAAEEKLETELGMGLCEGRWDGVSQGDTVGEILGEFPMKSLQSELSASFMTGTSEKKSKVGEGWIAKLSAHLEFLIDESFEVMVSGELDGRGVRRSRLNDDFTGHCSTPGASGDLGEELEGTFSSPEVGSVE